MSKTALTLAVSLAMAGCASSMSGLDSGSKFACKAPKGVACQSLSGTYANALENNLPALRHEKGPADDDDSPSLAARPITGEAPDSGDPLLTKPKILRVWIAPWEDTEGDLHDQSYIYVVANQGRWAIEHNRRQILEAYRPTSLIQSPAGPASPQQRAVLAQGPASGSPLPQQAASPPAGSPNGAASPQGGVTLPGQPAYGPVNGSLPAGKR